MLVESLQTILQTARRAIGATCGGGVLTEELPPIDSDGFSFYVSGVFPQDHAPVRNIILSCDEGLAKFLASRLFSSMHAVAPDEEVTEATETAFRILCSIFQQMLAYSTQWYEPVDEVLQLGSGTMTPALAGKKSLNIRIPTVAGEMIIAVHPASRREADDVSIADADVNDEKEQREGGASATRVLSDEECTELLTMIAADECDVQIELYQEDSSAALHWATVLGRARLGENDVLTLSCPGLLRGDSSPDVGTPAIVYFSRAGQLFQFKSEIVGRACKTLEGGLRLPVIPLKPPEKIVEGQRRSAFRTEPTGELLVEIGAWRRSGHSQAGRRHVCRIGDISFSGARVTTADESVMVSCPEGSLIACSIQLPEEWGEVEIPALVRRIESRHMETDEHEVHLGIEFLAFLAAKEFESALEQIRQYVLSVQREAMKRVGNV